MRIRNFVLIQQGLKTCFRGSGISALGFVLTEVRWEQQRVTSFDLNCSMRSLMGISCLLTLYDVPSWMANVSKVSYGPKESNPRTLINYGPSTPKLQRSMKGHS